MIAGKPAEKNEECGRRKALFGLGVRREAPAFEVTTGGTGTGKRSESWREGGRCMAMMTITLPLMTTRLRVTSADMGTMKRAVLSRTDDVHSTTERFTPAPVHISYHTGKGKGSPYSITERRVPELIPIIGSQPAGDVSHKPGGRLPLLSARHAVIPAAIKRASTSFAAW